MLDGEWKKWFPPPRPLESQLKGFNIFCSSRHEDDNGVNVKTVVFKLSDKIVSKVGMNWGKMPPHVKMAYFLLEWQYRSHDFFVRLRNEFRSSVRMWKAGKNIRGRYRACRSRPRPVTLNYNIFRQMWHKSQIWWVLGYGQASKIAVKAQKNNSFSSTYNRDLTGRWPARALIKRKKVARRESMPSNESTVQRWCSVLFLSLLV